jgi:hypothetical protein
MRTNLSSKSVPRFELDQRSREVRLRLERIERLLVSHASVTHSWLRRLLSLFGVGMCGGDAQDGRARGLLSNWPSRMPTILEVWRLAQPLP